VQGKAETRLLLMVLIIADLGPGQTQLDGGGHLFPFFFFSPLGLLCWADNFEKNGFLAGGPATGTR
jgi:hypothetical protein